MSHEFMVTSLISGGFAGIICDLTLYPIDTIKTRLQAKRGFLKSGGFNGIYRGLASVALGSIPNASVFFIAYDSSKYILPNVVSSATSVHIIAGCIGEVSSCCIRMPFEVVKQTAQAGGNFTSRTALIHIVRTGGLRGLFSGFFSTIYRDVPYTALQMPIWEYLKLRVALYCHHGDIREVTALQSGICGSVAGGVSSAVTTPLDVAKTRIILSERTSPNYTENPFRVMYQVFQEEGVLRLFSGVTPRVLWISAGGFLFFGAYDFAKICLQKYYWKNRYLKVGMAQ